MAANRESAMKKSEIDEKLKKMAVEQPENFKQESDNSADSEDADLQDMIRYGIPAGKRPLSFMLFSAAGTLLLILIIFAGLYLYWK